MKNKTLVIIGAVMVLLAVISVVSWLALKPSEEDNTDLSVNKSVLSELPEEETTTKAVQAEITRKSTTYEWESVIEPTISENYMIITAAGGNGEWQVFENEDSYKNGYKPAGGGIIIE